MNRFVKRLLVSKLILVITLLGLSSLQLTVAQDSAPSFETETGYIARVLELSPGMTVADVGAGDGKYSVFISGQVGVTGKVYSTEVTQENINAIRANVAGKNNVTVIMGEHDSTQLPEQCCDRILLRRVYHHFQQPHTMLSSLYDSLKPGGVIAIIDFLRHDMERSDATPDDHEHGVRTHDLIDNMKHAGFEFIREVEDWPSRVDHGRNTDFCILFRKPV
jgi:ubiquinone/menaquinone biosynthesis C-methylase UbiE